MKKDFILRILKTFFQAVGATLIVQLGAGVDFTSKEAVKNLAVALVAAGLSAVMNINKLTDSNDEDEEEGEEDEAILL